MNSNTSNQLPSIESFFCNNKVNFNSEMKTTSLNDVSFEKMNLQKISNVATLYLPYNIYFDKNSPLNKAETCSSVDFQQINNSSVSWNEELSNSSVKNDYDIDDLSYDDTKTNAKALVRDRKLHFTTTQRFLLEEEFKKNLYITGDRKKVLAHYLNLSEMQVKTWFQNRRTKLRKEVEKKKEQLAESLLLLSESSSPPKKKWKKEPKKKNIYSGRSSSGSSLVTFSTTEVPNYCFQQPCYLKNLQEQYFTDQDLINLQTLWTFNQFYQVKADLPINYSYYSFNNNFQLPNMLNSNPCHGYCSSYVQPENCIQTSQDSHTPSDNENIFLIGSTPI